MKIKVIQSRSYEKFSFYQTNRIINYAHVKRLMASILTYGLLEEITINEFWQIIDGQHRFEALKALDMPIIAKVKVGATEENVIPLNIVRRGWSLQDYINHYQKKGVSDYVYLNDVLANNDTKLGLSTMVHIYSDDFYKPVSLREGNYKINIEKGNELRDMVMRLEPYIHMYSLTRKFVIPLSNIVKNNDNFQVKRLISQLQKYKLTVYPNSTDTSKSIVEVYNRRLSEKNRIF